MEKTNELDDNCSVRCMGVSEELVAWWPVNVKQRNKAPKRDLKDDFQDVSRVGVNSLRAYKSPVFIIVTYVYPPPSVWV